MLIFRQKIFLFLYPPYTPILPYSVLLNKYISTPFHLFICRYEHDTDHGVHQMNIFHSETNEPMGVINWFAVHPTSMNNTNHLISGDNKGLASQLLEKYVNPSGQLTGTVSNIQLI